LAEIKKAYPEIQAGGGVVYALSADGPEQSAAFGKEMGLPFELLCDPERIAIKTYDLLNPHEHDGIAYPALFVINGQGIVCYRSLDRTGDRVDLRDVLGFLKRLVQAPDLKMTMGPRKRWVVPTPESLRQLGRNLLRRGNSRDWRHYREFSLRPFQMLLGRRKKP